MRKYLQSLNLILLTLITSISLSSCHSDKKIKIGFLLSNLKDDRYVREKAFFDERIKQMGAVPLIYSADLDDKLQIKQAQKCIAQGAKVLVVNSVNLNTAAAIVRSAHDKGVKVIAYDRLILNSDLDYYVAFDSHKIGQLMADYVTKVKPEGNYILLGGDKADLNATLVKDGQLQVLNPLIKSGKIKVLMDIFVQDWSADNAYHQIKRCLNLTDQIPDVIVASNDGMASGAIRALKEFHLAGKVLVTGQDAQLEACRYIVRGYQSMTVYKSSKTLVNKATDIAMRLAKDEKISEATSTTNNGFKEVPSILLEPVAVDSSNLKSTIIADGYLTADQLYK